MDIGQEEVPSGHCQGTDVHPEIRETWVVDMDLFKCFDTLDHEIIIRPFRKRIADGSILKLLRLFLTSGG